MRVPCGVPASLLSPSDPYMRLRHAAWMVRNARTGSVVRRGAVLVLAGEAEALRAQGVDFAEVVEHLAEYLTS